MTPAAGPAQAREPSDASAPPPPPAYRRLRIFAFDPSLDLDLDTRAINQAVVRVRWEHGPQASLADDETAGVVQPGPVGEYVEVVDVDPPSGLYYRAVDLNQRHLLAQDGLPPSEGDPQFHQQMVYAVAMLTIQNFEFALGRLSLWSSRRWKEGDRWKSQYVQRLRIYPHALREANAYYSPAKKALLFGYFPASVTDAREHLPRGTVFTCLSHDVVAHETTHALLDGLHRRYIEPTNPDVLAFHEGFADIVAIFQHFTFPEVVRHQIASTRGDLQADNLLAKLAVQFGRATGKRNALRDALGRTDENGTWRPDRPDPQDVDTALEPHARGAILVAAVFDAFVSIYKRRTHDLIRIATGGSGVLNAGDLQPDLVNRLASEAAKSAQHVLTICIRALDYCPPVDITFGEYLRAMITADTDLVTDDDLGYRVAFINAFRQRGLYPHDVRSLSVDSLCWQRPNATQRDFLSRILPDLRQLRRVMAEWDRPPLTSRASVFEDDAPTFANDALPDEDDDPRKDSRAPRVRLSKDREAIYERMRLHAAFLHTVISKRAGTLHDDGDCIGLDLRSSDNRQETFEIHSVRPTRRIGPDGQALLDLVVVITQRKRVLLNAGTGTASYEDPDENSDETDATEFTFRGGCTLIIDPETGDVRYCIMKRIQNDARLRRQRQFYLGEAERSSLVQTLARSFDGTDATEPFALIHRDLETEHADA